MLNLETFTKILSEYHDSIHQNILDIATVTLIFALLDLFIIPKTSRWFSLHTISNTLTTWYSFPDFILVWSNPFKSIGIMNWRPLNITVTLHFYHMFFFSNLNTIDWVHHIVMMYVAVYMYLYPLGAPINAVIFFVNGLPGGLDYFLLALVKHNLISPLTEKKINVYLNNWIRSPGLIISTYLSLLVVAHNIDKYDIPRVIPNFIPGYRLFDYLLGILIPLALYWNAQYFNQRVLLNYGKRITESSQSLEDNIADNLFECIQDDQKQDPNLKKRELAIVKYQVRDTFAKLRAKQNADDVKELEQRDNHLTHLINV